MLISIMSVGYDNYTKGFVFIAMVSNTIGLLQGKQTLYKLYFLVILTAVNYFKDLVGI